MDNENTQITFKLTKEEFEVIKKGSALLGVGHTTFCRLSSLENARELAKKLL